MVYVFRKYMNNDIKVSKSEFICILCLIVSFCGFFGWFYEYIFYFFNSGMKQFYWRGGNFLPWINIYAIGAFMVILLTSKFRKNPFLVFLISFFSTGFLEFLSGFVIYRFFSFRFWDYNTEILNFMNIGGFVCFRSALFFGLSSLFLIYFLVPLCIYFTRRFNFKRLFWISVILCLIILFDELYNLIVARIFSLPRAHDVYSMIGFNFMNYR